MYETSLITLLQQQKEKNEKAYQALFGDLNLSKVTNFQSLPKTNLTTHQSLVNAGFKSASPVDKFSETDLKIMLYLAKQDISRFYLEEDLKCVADRYGLKKLQTYEYKGKQQNRFASDLENFQATLEQADLGRYFGVSSLKYNYHLLGATAALHGYEPSKRYAAKHTPLLFLSLSNGIYYLISNYDCWVQAIRKFIYLPFAKPSISVPIALLLEVLVAIFSSDMVGLLILDVMVLAYLLMGVIHFSWTMPTPLPDWLGKIVYRILP